MGNSIIASIFMSIAVFLNILLDPIFIFVMDMGVTGAALATSIARGSVAFIFSLTLLRGKTGFKIYIKEFIPHPKIIKKVFAIGLPASVGQSVTAIGLSIIVGVVANFGPTVISG